MMGWISKRHMRTGGSINRNPSQALAKATGRLAAEGLMTADDVRADLQKWVTAAGSVSGVARDLGVHDEQLRLFMTGKRPLEPTLARALHLERVALYRRAAADRAETPERKTDG